MGHQRMDEYIYIQIRLPQNMAGITFRSRWPALCVGTSEQCNTVDHTLIPISHRIRPNVLVHCLREKCLCVLGVCWPRHRWVFGGWDGCGSCPTIPQTLICLCSTLTQKGIATWENKHQQQRQRDFIGGRLENLFWCRASINR